MNNRFQSSPAAIPSKRRGSSLIEVVLAIGIISFALIPVMAMLPTGMKTLRDAMDRTVRAQILSQIHSDLLLEDIQQLEVRRIGFDEQGRETDVVGQLHHLVEIEPRDPAAFHGDEARAYPGSPASISDSLAHVRLTIWSGPGLTTLSGIDNVDEEALEESTEKSVFTMVLAARARDQQAAVE